MKKYLSLLKLRFNICLQYRGAALGGMFTQFFWGILEIMVFTAFYKSDANTDITLQQLVSLFWLRQAFYPLRHWNKDSEITDLIEKGNISYELCRPLSIYWLWYCKSISTRIASTLLKCFPIIFFAMIMPNGYSLVLPESITSFILFIISIVFSLLVIASIMNIVYITVFHTISSKGSFTLFYALATFFSGGQIPIALMPNMLQRICYILPFSLVGDLPYRIYSGNISTNESIMLIGVQILWSGVLVVLGNMMLNKALKKVVVQGG